MKLNSKWIIYVHDINDRDWSLQSYKKCYVIKTIIDFWVFFNNIKNYNKFQFFIMRDNIKPVYEDPANVNGGSYSYRIYNKFVHDTFENILVRLIGEQLIEKNVENITGVSLVPKGKNSILKIWLSNQKKVPLNVTDLEHLNNGRFQNHRF
jgi:translation initiation factor 4E